MPLKVFISFKNLDETGNPSRDSVLAREVHDFLVHGGLDVFFSAVSLERMGVAAYKQAIDDALDRADVLIAVGTSRQHLTSEWVRYEGDSFANEILSGVKPHGRIFVYVEDLAPAELPRALRQMQAIQHGPQSLDLLHRFIVSANAESSSPSIATAGDAAAEPACDYSCAASDAGGTAVKRALLDNGNSIAYLASPHSQAGSTKTVHLTPDGQYAIKLYRKSDPAQLDRLRLLVGAEKCARWFQSKKLAPCLPEEEAARAGFRRFERA